MKIWNLVALLAMLTGGLFISGCADSDAGTEGQATETAPEDPSDPAEDCPDGEDCDEQDGDSSSDSSDADDADPSDEEEVEETTGGLDCSTDEGLCEAPYECILGTCRIPISGISEAQCQSPPPGRTMIRTPARPITTAAHRWNPTFSFRISTLNPVASSG